MNPKLKIIQSEDCVKVQLSNPILDKIEYLCKNIPDVEWSGILFYEVKGSIKNPSKMKIICKDILLMDRGSKGYTEYDWGEDVVSYMIDNPQAMEWKKGHIHSHNTMSVFFSGTDMAELNDNCPNHNIYFSLIVNNYNDMQAKVAVACYLPEDTLIMNNEDGDEISFKYKEKGRIPYAMYIINCKIDYKQRVWNIDNNFSNRLTSVITKSKQRDAAKAAQYNNSNKNKPATISSNASWGVPQNIKEVISDEDLYEKMLKEEELPDEYSDHVPATTVEGKFSAYVLRLASYYKDDSVTAALEDLDLSNINPESIADSIMNSYGVYYATFFEAEMDEISGPKFNKTLGKVINLIEAEKDTYPEYVNPVVEALKSLKAKLK